MPISGSSAYGTVAACTSLIRSLVNDVAANWATDSILLPYVNAAYLDIQFAIANAGGDEFITETELIVVAVPSASQDPGTQTVINDATAAPNDLPSNLIVPIEIWERPNLTTQDFQRMQDLTNAGGLPSRIQESRLNVWEWRTDGIYFIGATQDTQIRLRYQAYFNDLTGPNDTIMIRGAKNAMAYRAAELAAGARGSPMIEPVDKLYADALESLVLQNVRANQQHGRRRRPYGQRGRGGLLWF